MLGSLFVKIQSGGVIMWLLLGVSLLIWSGLIARWERLNKSSFEKSLFSSLSFNSLELLLEEKKLKSLIAVAPLLGLLGTVGGMVETFASLETMEMFRPGGGIASGISQALLTTQMGLIVSVPAMLALKFIDRNKKAYLENLEVAQ